MKVRFETSARKFEHEYSGIDNCTKGMMLFIHLDLMHEYSDLIAGHGTTTFLGNSGDVVITTTIEERG